MAIDHSERRLVSRVAWHDGKVIAAELDRTVAPARDFVEEMIRPTPRWRLVAYDERGACESIFDTLIADPILLAADVGGVIVGDRGRLHLRATSGHWTSVEGLELPTGLGSESLVSVTETHVTFAQPRRPRDGKPYSTVTRLDRRSGVVEALPDLQEVEAICASEQSLAWAPAGGASYVAPTVMIRPLFASEPVTSIELPSRVRRLTYVGTDLVMVLDQGFGVFRGGRVRVLHAEHRFVQLWPAATDCWYALIGGTSTYRGSQVERVGACLCRIREDDIEIFWAEVPPPLNEEFEVGAPISLAVGGSRLFFVHRGRIEMSPTDGRRVEPIRVSGPMQCEPGRRIGPDASLDDVDFHR